MRKPEKFEPQFEESEMVKPKEAKKEINTSQIVKNFQEESRAKLNILEQRVDDLGELQEVGKGLGQEIKEKDLKSSELKLAGEKIYSSKFVEKLDEILNHEFKSEDGEKTIVLRDVVDKHLKKFSKPEFSKLSKEEQVDIQKNFVKDLISQIGEIPHRPPSEEPWNIDFERGIKTGSLNCAVCSDLTGLILESTKEFTNLQKIEYGNPYSHAMNIVTFGDGRIYCVDSRNNIFEDLTDNVEIEEKNGFCLYKIKQLKGKRWYKVIPALPIKEGILNSYLDNLHSVYQAAKGKFEPYFRKTRATGQLEKTRAGAEMICKEEGLSKEKYQFLEKVRKTFSGNLIQYEKSEEFRSEVKRWEEAFDFEKDYREVSKRIEELVGRDEKIRQEIISKKDEIISFLLFKTNELSLENEEAKKLIESFRESKKKLRHEHPSWYEENIQQRIEALKSVEKSGNFKYK